LVGQGQSRRAKDMLTTSQRQADAMDRLRQASDAQATATGSLATTSKEQLGELASSVMTAQTAATAAKDQVAELRRAQRPWVSAEDIVLYQPISKQDTTQRGFNLYLEVVFKNTGNSIATDGQASVTGYSASAVGRSPDVDLYWDQPCKDAKEMFDLVPHDYIRPRGFVVAPGDTVTFPINTGVLNIDDVDAYSYGFFILGCAIYHDEFHNEHKTRFCFTARDDADKKAGHPHFRHCDSWEEAD